MSISIMAEFSISCVPPFVDQQNDNGARHEVLTMFRNVLELILSNSKTRDRQPSYLQRS